MECVEGSNVIDIETKQTKALIMGKLRYLSKANLFIPTFFIIEAKRTCLVKNCSLSKQSKPV
jgi:hypothetical protein